MSQEPRTLHEIVAWALSISSSSDFMRVNGRANGITKDEVIGALGACRDGPDDFGPELIEHSALGDGYSDKQIEARYQLVLPRWRLAFESECYPARMATKNVTKNKAAAIDAAIRYSLAHHCRGRKAGQKWDIETLAKRSKCRIQTFMEFVVVSDYVRNVIEGEAMARLRLALY